MSVGRICTRVVATASSRETVRAAAERMAEHNVGTLVVVEDAKPVGIVTDRDLVLRAVATGLDPEGTRIEDVMTGEVRSLDEDAPLEEGLEAMKRSGVRRVVVTGGDGTLAGILSLDDVLELLVEEVERIGGLLAKESPRLDEGA